MPIPQQVTEEDLLQHPVVSRDDWIRARKQLLQKEKELTRLYDAIAAERRALPWVKVEKQYRFETENGHVDLAGLFGENSQLLVYHFMFGPGWDEGCGGCSFLADHFDGANWHLPHADVSLVAVSRAPLQEFLPFKKRMGWHFPWVSSNGCDFNFDYQASFTQEAREAGKAVYNFEPLEGEGFPDDLHGFSVFYKATDGTIYHTYSCYARGSEVACGTLRLLDLVPKGRNESSTMNWVRLHDKYESPGKSSCCGCC